ncbi:MAG: hypothetical protein J6K63_06795 [Clostridia bacterium]|nr:hypothetical protein [Clostridia bacterium]
MRFYGWNILYVIISIFLYITFRFGVEHYLRYTKNSKTFIRKNQQGFWNYWFYLKMRSELNLFYWLNALLLPLTLAYLVLTVSLGWLSFMQIPIAVLSALLCIVQIPSVLLSGKYDNLWYHGKVFLWLRRNPAGGGWDSSLFHIVGLLGIVAFVIYNICSAIL